jgi:hypothetical protein
MGIVSQKCNVPERLRLLAPARPTAGEQNLSKPEKGSKVKPQVIAWYFISASWENSIL